MSIFGKILKTGIDLATTPIAVVKDIATLGGAITDEPSAIVRKVRQLGNDVEEIKEEAEKL
jgi:hypothetical protein